MHLSKLLVFVKSFLYYVVSLLEPVSYSADPVITELIQTLYLSDFPGSKSTLTLVSRERFDNVMCACLSFMLPFFNFSTQVPVTLEVLHLNYSGFQE